MKALFAALGAALLLATAVAPVARSGPDRRPTFAGTTRFETDRHGELVVHLPRSVHISTAPFDSNFATIRSEGPLAGVVLRQLVPEGLEVIALSADVCTDSPCMKGRVTFTRAWDPKHRSFPEGVTLPPGDYGVYVVAEGSTEIDLSLPGLGGQVRLAPRVTRHVDSVIPETTFDPLPQHKAIYNAEAHQTLEAPGWAILALELETSHDLYGEAETCLQRQPSQPLLEHVSAVPLLRSCSGSGAGSFYVGRLDENRTVVLTLDTVGRGDWFQGVLYRTAARVTGFNAIGVGVEFPGLKRRGRASTGAFWHDD